MTEQISRLPPGVIYVLRDDPRFQITNKMSEEEIFGLIKPLLYDQASGFILRYKPLKPYDEITMDSILGEETSISHRLRDLVPHLHDVLLDVVDQMCTMGDIVRFIKNMLFACYRKPAKKEEQTKKCITEEEILNEVVTAISPVFKARRKIELPTTMGTTFEQFCGYDKVCWRDKLQMLEFIGKHLENDKVGEKFKVWGQIYTIRDMVKFIKTFLQQPEVLEKQRKETTEKSLISCFYSAKNRVK